MNSVTVRIAAAILLAGAAGCDIDSESLADGLQDFLDDPSTDEEWTDDGSWWDTNESALELSDGSMEGDMGRVTGVSAPATELTGWHSEGYSHVTVMADTAGGAVMQLIDVTGGLDHPDIVPGAVLHFDGDDWDKPLIFSVTGCAGPDPGEWEFDQPADDVTVEIDEDPADPSVMLMTVTASFIQIDGWDDNGEPYGPEQVSTGIFAVRRP